MRYWSLAVLFSSSLGCYLGPLDAGDDSTEGGTTGGEATGNDSMMTAASGPSDPTVASGPMETSVTASTSSGPGDTSGSTSEGSSGAAEESSGGEMSGCESGPLAAPLPGCTPTPLASTGDIHQDCVDRINQFRWECQCLPPLARWNAAEDCTDQQSSDDQNGGGPHGNFGACGENAQNTCPNWGSEQQVVNGCLQAMWDEGPGEPFSEHGHYINMSNTGYSKVACGFSSSGAGVWANQNFSP